MMKKLNHRNLGIALIIIITAVLLAGAVFLVSIYKSEDLFSKNVERIGQMELKTTLNHQLSMISQSVSNQFSQLRFLTMNISCREDFEKYVDAGAFDGYVESNRICMLGVADINGDAIGYDGTLLGNISSGNSYKQIMSGAERFIEYLSSTSLTNEPRFIFSIPLKDDSDRITGVLFFAKEVEVIGESLFSDSLTNGSIELYLVDATGLILTENDFAGDRASGKTTLFDFHPSGGFPDDMSAEDMKKCLGEGKEGSFIYTHPDTGDELVCFSSANIADWSIVAMIDKDVATEAYSENQRQIEKTFWGIFIALFLVLIYVAFLSVILLKRYMTRKDDLIKKQEKALQLTQDALTESEEKGTLYSQLSQILANEYTVIFLLDLKTNAYIGFSGEDRLHGMKKAYEGPDYITFFNHNANTLVYDEDRERVISEIDKKLMTARLAESGSYSVLFRFFVDGEILHYQAKITTDIQIEDKAVVGIRCVDEETKQQAENTLRLEELHLKEKVFRDAVISNCEAQLFVNLTQNKIIGEVYSESGSNDELAIPAHEFYERSTYDEFLNWWAEQRYLTDKEHFVNFCSSRSLIAQYNAGVMNPDTDYTAKMPGGERRDCNVEFFLYKNEVGDICGISVIRDTTSIKKAERKVAELSEQLREARIKNSVSQMQPHFLYNALASIREIMLVDPQYASDLICDFTTHLRACVRLISGSDLIPFSQELENIKAYVNIEKMRFGERLRVEYDIVPESFLIVPLSIQPMVENSIRHGIYMRGRKGGTVKVMTRENDSSYFIIVDDNGVGFDVDHIKNEVKNGTRDSTGLDNITFRLEKHLGATVRIKSTVGEGTRITVEIPKDTNNTEKELIEK